MRRQILAWAILAICAVILIAQRARISSLESQHAALTARLGQAASATALAPADRSSATRSSGKDNSIASARSAFVSASGKINLIALAEALSSSIQNENLATKFLVLNQISHLTQEQLTSSLAQIPTLGLGPETSANLASALFFELSARDPGLAVRSATPMLSEPGGGDLGKTCYMLGPGCDWALKQPDEALAWLTTQLQSGALDAKGFADPAGIKIRIGIATGLIFNDPEQAHAALVGLDYATLNASLCEFIPINIANLPHHPDPSGFVALAQDMLPPNDAKYAITHLANLVHDPDTRAKILAEMQARFPDARP